MNIAAKYYIYNSNKIKLKYFRSDPRGLIFYLVRISKNTFQNCGSNMEAYSSLIERLFKLLFV